MKLGAVVISRNDGYGGDQPMKATYSLTSLLNAFDEVIYVDWNSPNDVSLMDIIGAHLPRTGKLRCIQVTQDMHKGILQEVCMYASAMNPNYKLLPVDAQHCVEALARNIGLRRLQADYLVSCNADVMCLDRDSIVSKIRDFQRPKTHEHTFHCVARRETDFAEIKHLDALAASKVDSVITAFAAGFKNAPDKYGQFGDGSPLGERDPWSLISCPGDFQLAHRDVWFAMRGFEEAFIARGYNDTNVQKKAVLCGYGLELVRDIPVFHFGHYPGTGGCGGTTCGMNDPEDALFGFTQTRNPESWGFGNAVFSETRM